MPRRLASAELKLTRAVEHFRALQQEVAVFMASKPYALSREKHVGDRWLQVRFLNRRNPPIRLGLLAGDTIDNANAALDHLVWGLSRTKPDKTGFPVYIDPISYLANREMLLNGVRPYPERAIIDAYQPYEDRMQTDPLWLLRKFANTDKHRITEPAFARPRNLRVKAPPGYVIEVTHPKGSIKLKNLAELLRYRITGPDAPQGSVPVETEIDISIGFSDTLRIDLVDIEEILARVGEVIGAF